MAKSIYDGMTIADFPNLAGQWHQTLNGELRPEDVAIRYHTRAWWQCDVAEDHVWDAPLRHRARGTGCPFCAGQRVSISNSLSALHPELAAQWHPTKNRSLTPDKVTAGSKISVWWQCAVSLDHEWQAIVSNRTTIANQTGCPYCTGQKVNRSNCLAVTHPELAAQWHPTKNGALTPFGVVAGSVRTIWWLCPAAPDHEWQATPGKRMSENRGCPCCAGKKVVPSNCLRSTHTEVALQWHPYKNNGLTAEMVVAGSNRRVWWLCPAAPDHEWQTTPNCRTAVGKATGCPCCTGGKVVPSNSLATTHPEVAAEWHPSFNGKLSPIDVNRGSNKKIWWKCNRCSYVWSAMPNSRTLKKAGCPKCKLSIGERAIQSYLDHHNIPNRTQWGQGRANLPKRYAFDFAVNRQEEFWLIEYHGEQHYLPQHFGSRKPRAKYRRLVDAIRRDQIKEYWCWERKKNLLVIPYWEFDRIEVILNEFFSGNMLPVMVDPPEIVKKYEPMRTRIKEWLSRKQGGQHVNRHGKANQDVGSRRLGTRVSAA